MTSILSYLCCMDHFTEIAETVVIYKIRSAWHEIARMYNEIAADYDGTLSMGFVLLALDEKTGTPVTKIAPRMGLEPNSLSRLLKSMEKKHMIYRKRDDKDKRKVYIELTEYGKEMRQVAMKAVFRLNNAITKDISAEKLDAFFEVMNQVPKSVARMRQIMQQ